MKLRTKMLLSSVVPMVVSLAALTGWNAVAERRALGEGQAEKARSVSALLVGVVGPNILFKDANAARDGLKQFEADGEFRYAIAVDENKATLASVGNAEGIAAFGALEALPVETLVEVRGGDRVAVAPVRSGSHVVGAVIIGLSQDKVNAASRSAALADAGLALLACLAAAFIAFTLGRSMLGAVGETACALEGLANGDLTVRLEVKSNDEMGQMGRAVNHALERVGSTLQGIHAALSRLGSASSKLSALSAQLGENASNTSAQASSAASAAETVSVNTNTVAAATEEMGSSVKEIARNAGDAAEVARGAVQTAEATHASMGKLDEASREIGNVVKLINAIAEQTNLLALNATIEAARAGEAGKGFAVVATEVKELAKQTAQATEDIGKRVSGIQTYAREAVEAIKQIRTVIGQVNDFQTAIATAVEEQAATTREIGRNVAGAAEASAAIAGSITSLAQSAQGTNDASAASRESAQELARVASDLQQLVSRFRFSKVAAGAAPPARALPASTPPPLPYAALQNGARA